MAPKKTNKKSPKKEEQQKKFSSISKVTKNLLKIRLT